MSVAAIFPSRFDRNEVQRRAPWTTRPFVRKLGAWGFVFFALKGIAWLMLPLIGMYFA